MKELLTHDFIGATRGFENRFHLVLKDRWRLSLRFDINGKNKVKQTLMSDSQYQNAG